MNKLNIMGKVLAVYVGIRVDVCMSSVMMICIPHGDTLCKNVRRAVNRQPGYRAENLQMAKY